MSGMESFVVNVPHNSFSAGVYTSLSPLFVRPRGGGADASFSPEISQAVQQPGAVGKSYTVVNVKGPAPDQDDWDRLFSEL